MQELLLQKIILIIGPRNGQLLLQHTIHHDTANLTHV